MVPSTSVLPAGASRLGGREQQEIPWSGSEEPLERRLRPLFVRFGSGLIAVSLEGQVQPHADHSLLLEQKQPAELLEVAEGGTRSALAEARSYR